MTNRVRGAEGRWIRMRMGLFCGILSLAMGLVVSSGYDIMVRDGESWLELAEQQRKRRLSVRPKRGMIYDRNGSALAASIEVPTISLDAKELMRGVESGDVPRVARETALRIASALDLDPVKVERKILARRRWSWLRRHASPEQVEAVRLLSSAAEGERIRGLLKELKTK